jgi:hypothetical protein
MVNLPSHTMDQGHVQIISPLVPNRRFPATQDQLVSA